MINRLLRVTVETGLACAVAATLELVFFLALPDTNMHFIVCVRACSSFGVEQVCSRSHRALILSKGTALSPQNCLGTMADSHDSLLEYPNGVSKLAHSHQ